MGRAPAAKLTDEYMLPHFTVSQVEDMYSNLAKYKNAKNKVPIRIYFGEKYAVLGLQASSDFPPHTLEIRLDKYLLQTSQGQKLLRSLLGRKKHDAAWLSEPILVQHKNGTTYWHTNLHIVEKYVEPKPKKRKPTQKEVSAAAALVLMQRTQSNTR